MSHDGLLAALAALCCAACAGPKISRFDVRPQALCAGDTASVGWTADGDVALTVKLDDPRLAAAGAADDALAPYTVTLTLRASKRGQTVERHAAFEQLPAESRTLIGFPTAPSADGAAAIARGEKSLQRWGDRFEVSTVAVSAPAGRDLVVVHADRTAPVPGDGTPSDALRGTPLEGPWELRATLSDAERQGRAAVPDHLIVAAAIRCKGGQP